MGVRPIQGRLMRRMPMKRVFVLSVSGGWTGDQVVDLSGGFGTIFQQSTGDFVMIWGAGAP